MTNGDDAEIREVSTHSPIKGKFRQPDKRTKEKITRMRETNGRRRGGARVNRKFSLESPRRTRRIKRSSDPVRDEY